MTSEFSMGVVPMGQEFYHDSSPDCPRISSILQPGIILLHSTIILYLIPSYPILSPFPLGKISAAEGSLGSLRKCHSACLQELRGGPSGPSPNPKP